MKKYQVEMTKNEAEVDGSASRNFGYDCENLAKIAKIWLRLRKFGISHNWVGYISHLMTFVTLTF